MQDYMVKIPTFSDHVQGGVAAGMVAAMLIYKSQWFSITPLPDDVYEITVREENEALLKSILNRK